MSPPLTGKQRRYLRTLGHSLEPVVQIGHAGLAPPVLKALDQALATHELVKVRVLAEKNSEVRALVPDVESSCKAEVAQLIGHTLLVYRRHPKKPKIELPSDKPAKGSRTSKAKSAVAKAKPPSALEAVDHEVDEDEDEEGENEEDEEDY